MEFWRNLKPIEKVFQPDALPEVYMANAATDDERYYVPFTAAGLVNRHYHPHEVFAYTISGKWGYLEHDWVATAGDFIYETPGEAHTLVAHDHPDPMKVFFIVKGPLVWLDDKGEPDGYFDVHQYIALCKAHYDKVGLGAALIDKLYR